MLILPPFYPPSIDNLAMWWRHCTYGEVHRLVLEVLHQRLTLVELDEVHGAAMRQVSAAAPDCVASRTPMARLGKHLELEIKRAAPIFRPTYAAIAPFSDEWLAREGMKCTLDAEPDADVAWPADFPALPKFQPPTTRDLREAWRTRSRSHGPMPLGQRLVLEVVRSRQLMSRIDRDVRALHAEAANAKFEPWTAARVNVLHELLKAEMREIELF